MGRNLAMYATRLKAVLIVLGLGLALVLVSLLRIQVLQGSRYQHEAEQRLRRPPGYRPTLRGSIVDRNGVALARDTGAYDVAAFFPFIEMTDGFVASLARKWRVDPDEARARVAAMWDELERLTGVPRDELDRRRQVILQRVEIIRDSVRELHGRRIRVREETWGERTSIPHPIVYDVDLKAVGVISSRPEQFPGLVLVPTRKREYPYGDTAPHVIGRMGETSAEELADGINAPFPRGDLKRYWPGDFIGRGGAESACEEALRGSRGRYQKGIEGNFLEDVEAVPGRDVRLTLDIALQGDVEDLLDRGPSGRVVGAAVVLDCATGEILALASAPRYDVRYFQADFNDLAASPDRPLVHRAASGLYPMGSTFKAVTAIAALQEGVLSPGTVLTCDGILDPSHPNRFRCHLFLSHGYGHGPIPLRTAVMKSCNVYFYTVAQLLSRDAAGKFDLAAGTAKLQDWASRLGLGRAVGLGLPGEAAGRVDVRDPRNLAVGQGELLATPLQAARLYGLVATDGRMPRPTLIRDLPHPPAPPDPPLNLKPAAMQALREAFSAVVNEPGGTGYGQATLPDVEVAGKTGTAQSGKAEDHAWFVGFAPARRPRIAFAVIVEHGGHGGTEAGPIAREIVRTCQAHGYLDAPAATSGGEKAPAARPLPPPEPEPKPKPEPEPPPKPKRVPLG